MLVTEADCADLHLSLARERESEEKKIRTQFQKEGGREGGGEQETARERHLLRYDGAHLISESISKSISESISESESRLHSPAFCRFGCGRPSRYWA